MEDVKCLGTVMPRNQISLSVIAGETCVPDGFAKIKLNLPGYIKYNHLNKLQSLVHIVSYNATTSNNQTLLTLQQRQSITATSVLCSRCLHNIASGT